MERVVENVRLALLERCTFRNHRYTMTEEQLAEFLSDIASLIEEHEEQAYEQADFRWYSSEHRQHLDNLGAP